MTVVTSTQRAGSPSASEPNETLGPYELLREIAAGGMGRVFVGRRRGPSGFKRLFAIKVLHPHLAEQTSFIEMFTDEAQLASQLHHPNVVAVVDVGAEKGQHYVAMDYVDGSALRDLLRATRSPRPPAALVSIFTDFLEGLHAAHELRDENGKHLGLVHRDISPDNLLVGADGVVRVTDFGIAKAAARLTHTQPGTLKGKPAYMAPEQLSGKPVDRRSDIFSAGVVLWTALTGKSLFAASSEAMVMVSVLRKPIPPPSTVGLESPRWLDPICMKALERDPKKRFSTTREMAEAIRQAAFTHGVLGSQRKTAEWLNNVLGERLEERRKLLSADTLRDLDTASDDEFPLRTDSRISGICPTDTVQRTATQAATARPTPPPPHSHSGRKFAGLLVGAGGATCLFLMVSWLLATPREPLPETALKFSEKAEFAVVVEPDEPEPATVLAPEPELPVGSQGVSPPERTEPALSLNKLINWNRLRSASKASVQAVKPPTPAPAESADTPPPEPSLPEPYALEQGGVILDPWGQPDISAVPETPQATE